jgi:ATP-dependent protease ClpP protease subunit
VNSVINLCGTIDEEAASRVAAQMRAAAGRDVELRIDSMGGKLFGAMLVCMEIEEHDRPVTTVVVGEASSAAALVTMAGDFRSIDRHGAMLVHWPQPRSLESTLDVLRAIEKYSGQPSMVVRGWLNEEKNFTADEAKRAGIVDSIIDVHGSRPVRLRPVTKRTPAPWLNPWREFCERLDLRAVA